MRPAAGSARTAHPDGVRPSAAIVTRKARRVQGRRRSAHAISPRPRPHAERGGEHPVEGLGVLVLEEEAERGVEHRAVHGRGGQHGRRHELLVGDRPVGAWEVADELAHADADREQVEDRLEEAGHERRPHARVRADVALDHPQRPLRAEETTAVLTAPASKRSCAPSQHPTAMHAPGRRRGRRGSPGRRAGGGARHSSTPCHSGETQATGCSHAGSWSTGKNVPENRNRGTMQTRHDDREREVAVLGRRVGAQRRGERQARERRRGHGEHAPRRRHGAEQRATTMKKVAFITSPAPIQRTQPP